jgi:hypothetical protein
MAKLFLIFLGVLTCSSTYSAVLSEPGVYSLPMNCSELLPDPSPFTNYFEAVGRGLVTSNRKLSTRIFKVMAIREKLADAVDRQRDQHPIDILIRKTLCFYREQKEPLKPVTYDDSNFISYLSTAMKELETKVDEIVYQWELDRVQRAQFEKIVEKNQHLIQKMKMEADEMAEAEVRKLSQKAKKNLREN